MKKKSPRYNPLRFEFEPKLLEDLSKVFGKHWRKIWIEIKLQTKSTIRKPYIIYIQDYPSKLILNDYDSCLRFAVNLNTGEVSEGLHVSSGEWAVHAGSNNDEMINDIPKNMLIVNVIWNDYNRLMKFKVQAPVGSLQDQIK